MLQMHLEQIGGGRQSRQTGMRVVETELGSMKRATVKADEQLLGQIPNRRKLYESIWSAKKK